MQRKKGKEGIEEGRVNTVSVWPLDLPDPKLRWGSQSSRGRSRLEDQVPGLKHLHISDPLSPIYPMP
jgi:hypothetical protein